MSPQELAQALEAAASVAPPGSMQYKGLQGDYVGGFWGTFVSAFTLLAVLVTWWTTKRIDYKTKAYQVFAEMLRTHEEIVGSLALGDFRGRDAVALILSEFSFIYKATQSHIPDYAKWDVHKRVNVAFTYTYYGPQLQTQRILSNFDPQDLKLIGDAVSGKQQSNARSRGKRHLQRLFKGHQNRLSHYFRNLYAAFTFIEQSDLSEAEKVSFGKVLRSKLSNYEQALLTLNVMSDQGREWQHSGLLAKYMPIKNVPKNFFSFDEEHFDLKNEFPYIVFEWEAPLSNATRA